MTHLTGRVKFVSEAGGAAARPERGLECPRPAKGRIQVQGQLAQSSWRESGGLFSACAVACAGPGVPTLSDFKTSMEAPPVQSVRRMGLAQWRSSEVAAPAPLRVWAGVGGNPRGLGGGCAWVYVSHC